MYDKNQRAISKAEWPVFVLIAWMGFLAVSCEKSEGLGGTGSITGTITEKFYNDDYSELILTAPAVDEEVFILFGNDKTPGDDVNTGASGDFRFDYLYPGTYHVYYRSEDSATLGDEQWPMIEVDIESGEKVNLGVLEKKTTLKYDDGAAVISGVVRKIKYDNDSKWPNLVVEYIDFAHEQEVYITYGNHTFYDERVRTQDDGYFEFKNLIPGKYRVFLFSEDVTKVTEHVVLEFETTLTEFDQVTDLGVITVEAI
jgi:hypothetical protein